MCPVGCSNTIDAIIYDPLNGIQADNEVPGTNISTISIHRLVVANHAVKYYCSIGRVPDYNRTNYINVLMSIPYFGNKIPLIQHS